VDIKGIEAAFLDSEERLANAMVETVKSAALTMLSYHCHKLIPMGVSCVGVLLESHISFHTWPDEGVITLDLFTCGSNPLIPTIPTIKRLFGIPRANDKIVTQWSHELRGFRSHKVPNQENQNYALLDHNSDLSQMIWSPMDCVYKEQVYSGLTEFQRVDVWDVVSLEDQPSQDDVIHAKLEPSDERWTTNELVKPTRYLFLDGVLQSDNTTHKEYHEALVHPAMFAHASPKHVAIVGGAEGATLREVFKHSTIESVTMVEIDQQLMDLAQEHLPQMSDCSNLQGRANNCFQDILLNLQVQDAKDWFIQESKQNAFDVVIVDAIEPEMSLSISKDLYNEPELWKKILESMTDEGILAIQIGYAPTITDPKPDMGYNAPREILFNTLEDLPSVQAMFVYEDSHVGFLVPKAFLIVCKSNTCRSRFYASPDDVNVEVSRRIVETTTTAASNEALQYYDGVTQIYYQVAPKAWETIYCRREPMPFECAFRHLDFNKKIFEFKVDKAPEEQVFDITVPEDEGGGGTGTRVFAKVDIPKGSYIMADHAASSLQLSHKVIENLSTSTDSDFAKFVQEHGHESAAKGSQRRLVEIGASYFIRIAENKDDANVGRWIPPHPQGKRPKYSPVYERHRLSFDVFMVASKDIAKGEELVKYKHMWDEE
jgi:S-adenosylmethionine decarboxylase proenzyme